MTRFEQQVREVIEASGITYAQLAEEAGVSGSQVGRFMYGERGLNSETLGKILDTLDCSLNPPRNRFTPKPIGRPRKTIVRGTLLYTSEDGGRAVPTEGVFTIDEDEGRRLRKIDEDEARRLRELDEDQARRLRELDEKIDEDDVRRLKNINEDDVRRLKEMGKADDGSLDRGRRGNRKRRS
jgi:transcriptional regulator with XRE-family HTH domain